jgi:hypothetical protein
MRTFTYQPQPYHQYQFKMNSPVEEQGGSIF